MTFTSVAPANSKTAEFAHLFDLFDRVATRRNRAQTCDISDSEAISADDIASVPAEFAPVLKNLSTILSLRALRNEHARRVSTASATNAPSDIRLTDATPTQHSMPPGSEDDFKNPAFPLDGERYPFTFKLMLHKLYDLEEWAEKVKDAVETSRSQFQPLADSERARNAAGVDSLSDIRGVRPISSVRVKVPSLSTAGTMPFKKPDSSRVLKKRCVGRRKSIDGPLASGVWVYDAAISATEIMGSRPAVEITLSAPVDTPTAVEGRSRHHSLKACEDTQDTTKRRVKIAIPLSPGQENVFKSVTPESSLSLGEPEQEFVLRRRRTVASTSSCKRAAIKRPLCI